MPHVRRHATFVIAAMLLPAALAAQSFKIEKFNIGGEGGTDYLTADPATGRIYISRATHVMIVDQATGKVIGDIPDTPRVHGIAIHAKSGHGFTTNAGDSTSTMFDAKAMTVIKKVHAGASGLDGIITMTPPTKSSRLITAAHWERPS